MHGIRCRTGDGISHARHPGASKGQRSGGTSREDWQKEIGFFIHRLEDGFKAQKLFSPLFHSSLTLSHAPGPKPTKRQ